MSRDRQQERIARSIGIALTAGMISAMPTAFGAPIEDASVSHVAKIVQTANAADTGKDTNITSGAANNVIGWKDFSVNKDEKVTFDNNNYMNIVTGANTSEINGIVQGGGDVYVINPNGIIFGKDAQVNVGNLYASTRYVSSTDAEGAATAGNLSSVLASPSAGVAMDVVNLGTINAMKVDVEGKNIRFISDRVTASGGVTLEADGVNGGYIHVGNTNGTAPTDYQTQSVTGTGSPLTAATAPALVAYQTVDGTNWKTRINGHTAGNYMLTGDIDATPATLSTKAADFGSIASFKGKFDGMFYTVKNMETTGGLFAKTDGATIENIGVVNSKITGGAAATPAGAIVGEAKDTILSHVYNEGTTTTGAAVYAAALVGKATGTNTIEYSYVSDASKAESGTMVGYIPSGEVHIDHSYILGDYGNTSASTLWGFSRSLGSAAAKLYVQNSYFGATATTSPNMSIAPGSTSNQIPGDTILIGEFAASVSAHTYSEGTALPGGTAANLTVTKDEVRRVALYNATASSVFGWGTDITNTGGVTITSTGGVTRPAWRIYEGRTLPVLTSMTKGIKTVDYNYAYYKKDAGAATYTTKDTAATLYNGGRNGGKDIPASATDLTQGLLYNAELLKITDASGNAITGDSKGNVAESSAIAFSGDRTTNIFYGKDGTNEGQLHATYANGTQQTLALLYSDQNGYDLVGGNISIAPREVTVPQADLQNVVLKKAYDGTAAVDTSKIAALYAGTSSNIHGILQEDKDAGLTVDTSGITGKYVNPDTTKAQTADADWDRPTAYAAANDNGDVGAKKYVYLNGTLTLTSGGSPYTGNDYVINAADANVSTFAKGLIYQQKLAVRGLPDPSTKVYDGKTYVVDGAGAARTFTQSDFTIDTSNIKGTDDVALSVTDGHAYYVDRDPTAGTVTKTKKVGTHEIEYGGLKLTGAAAGNYTLTDKNDNTVYSLKGVLTDKNDWNATVSPVPTNAGTSTDAGGFLYQSGGKITPRLITDQDYAWFKDVSGTLTEQDATRQYNGVSAYTDPTGHIVNLSRTAPSDALGLVSGDDMHFTVTSADFTTAQGASGTATKNVHNAALSATGAQAVKYTVTISGADADNYAFSSTPATKLADGGTAAVYGKGTITPRTLKVAATGTQAIKTYDGDARVKHGGTSTTNLTFNDGYIGYADNNPDYHLVANDTDVISYTGVYTNTYHDATNTQQTHTGAAKDVNWDATNGAVLAKDVTYTVTVKNGANVSANYTFVGAASAAPNQVTLDVNNGGRIDQKELSKLKMGFVQKVYDTSSAVNGGTANVVSGTNTNTNTIETALKGATADGLVTPTGHAAETVWDVFDKDKIAGAYGRGTPAADFTANAHVNRDATPAKNVINTTMRYVGDSVDATGTHHETSLADAITNHNYKLAAGVLNADGSLVQTDGGKITPLTITSVNLAANPITKVYDGNTDVVAPTGYESEGAAYYLTDHSVTSNKRHAMTATAGAGTINLDYSVVSGAYTSKDSHNGAAQDVAYKLKVTEDGDYALADSLKDTSGNYTHTFTGGGTITPKTVYASVLHAPLTKVYDGTNAAVSPDGLVKLDGLLDGENKSTGTYDTKHVGTGKAVTYTVALDSATQALGNYYIVDRAYTGNDPSHNQITSLTGTGTITKANLTASFADLTKPFDGGKALSTDNQNTVKAQNDNNQILKDRKSSGGSLDQVYLDETTLLASAYEDENAGAHKINYKLLLKGADAGNYQLVDASGTPLADDVSATGAHTGIYTVQGNGTILSKTLSDTDIRASWHPVTKDYDGSTDVAYDHTGWTAASGQRKNAAVKADSFLDRFTIGGTELSTEAAKKASIKSVKGTYGNDGKVGTTEAKFTISLDDSLMKNYDLTGLSSSVYDPTNKIFTFTVTNGTNGNSVSITPQNVIATVAKNPTKIYDGTTDLMAGSTQTSTGTPLTNALTDGCVTLARADARTDAAAWGTTSPTVTGVYASKDVKLKADGTADTQTVNYTATVGANYKLINADGSIITGGALTGLGTIEQKEISVTPAAITKEYDGNALATAANLAVATNGAAVAGAVGTDTFGTIFNAGLITGCYGKADAAGKPVYDTDGKLIADETVRRVGGVAAEKPTSFTAASGDIKDAMNLNSFGARNYKMADGKKAIEGKGTITPKGISAADITPHWNPISREYDGTTFVKTASTDDGDYTEDKNAEKALLTLTTTINGTPVTLDYDLTKATFNRTDAGSGIVTYQIARLADKEFANYELSADIAPWLTNAANWTHTGTITPRVLKRGDAAAVSKVYDGTTAVDTADNLAKSANGVTAMDNLPFTRILVRDAANGVKVAMDATNKPVFNSETVASATMVTYHAEIVGDSAGNYTFAAGPSTLHALTYMGKGKITPKELVMNAAVTDVDRVYDGTTGVDAAGRTKIQNAIRGNAANWTGIVTRGGVLDDVSLASFDANYVGNGGHVQRESDGRVLDNKKTILLSNLTAGGADAGNYKLVPSDGIRVTGKITPKVLTVTGPTDAAKTYDGTDHMENPETRFTATGEVGTDTAAFTADGRFAGKNVDDTLVDTDKAIYTLSITNGDYALDGATAATPYAMTKTVKGKGRINPYTLQLVADDVTKPYDATSALPNAAGTYLKDANRPTEGDAVTITADGVFGGPNAGSYANNVRYTNLAIDPATNPHGNYVLDAAQAAGGVTGNGTITPRILSIAAHEVGKVYDGTRKLLNGSTDLTDSDDNLLAPSAQFDVTSLQESDTLAGLGLSATGKYKDKNVSTADVNGPGATYHVKLTNGNYALAQDADGNFSQETDVDGKGRITPRTIAVQADTAEKVYDTTTALSNAASHLSAVHGAGSVNTILAGDTVKVKFATGTFQSKNVAGTPGKNLVDYTGIALDNPNYALASDRLDNQAGTIKRRVVKATATPATRYIGDPMTGFGGQLSVDTTDTTAEQQAALKNEATSYTADFDWRTDAAGAAAAVPGKYGIYGSYHGSMGGDLGANYTFSQDPFNDTALDVQMLDPGAAFHAATTEGLVRPDRTVYTQVSKDRTSDYADVPRYTVDYTAGGIGSGKDAELIARDTTVERKLLDHDAYYTVNAKDAINLTGGDADGGESLQEAI